MNLPLVAVSGLAKSYRPRGRRTWLLEDLTGRVRGRRKAPRPLVWALQDVSFDVPRGRSLGVVGPNGAGKSTLLRILAGISQPTRGRVTTSGRISTQLGLGVGFNPYLSGRENLLLEGSILGMTNAQVRQRMSSITDFAGLDGAIDSPLWTYSSGMVSRLGFAVAVHVDFDLLLLDEALSAGDAAFRERCDAALARFRDEGRTLIIVSHSHDQIRRLCDDAIWLQKGVIQQTGPADAVVDAYEIASTGQAHRPTAPA